MDDVASDALVSLLDISDLLLVHTGNAACSWDVTQRLASVCGGGIEWTTACAGVSAGDRECQSATAFTFTNAAVSRDLSSCAPTTADGY